MFENLIEKHGSSGPSLENFRRFCMVVEAGGNMAEAARREKRGNPARHHSAPNDIANDFRLAINKLEKTFGAELTKNTRRGACEVTPAGRRLYLTLTEYASALDMVGKDAEAPPEELSVACSGGGFIDWQWNPRYEAVKQQFPEVKRFTIVSRRTGQLIEMLKGAEVDIGIMDKARVPRELDKIPFSTTRFSMFVPARLTRTSLFGKKTKLNKDEISSIRFAGLEGESKHMQTLVKESAKHGYNLKIEAYFGGFPQMLNASVYGKCAAILPEDAGRGFNLDGMIVMNDLPFLKALERENVIVWNKRLANFRRYLPKAARRLKKAMLTPLP